MTPDEATRHRTFPTEPLLERRRPLLPLAPGMVRLLHRVSLVWAVVVVVFLELARRELWLRHQPGTETFEITARPAFLALFAVGALLAWRWEIVGGAIAAFTAGGVIEWQGNQLVQPDATLVIAAFAVPGLMWVALDLHDRRPRTAIAGIVVVAVALLSGRTVAADVYDDLFGPTHPASTATTVDGSRFEWWWTGAVTTSSAVITARLADTDDTTATLTIRRPEGAVERLVERYTETPDAHGIVRFHVTGLAPGTRYEAWSGRDGDVLEATFRTFPDGPASFTIAVGACARVGSNGAVWDAIGEVAPNLLVLDGDLHYANIERPSPELFRSVLDLQLSRPGPAAVYRTTPVAYVWDDHDFGGNNGDSSSPTRQVALDIYRQYVPHYPLADPTPDAPIHQAFDLGRARVIVTDGRSERVPAADAGDPSDATMLGDEQLAWLEHELVGAAERDAVVIWVNASPWVQAADPTLDGWGGYAAERARIADVVARAGIADRLLMLSGDAHMVAIDDGTNTDYSATGQAGFPLLHGGALDRPGSVKGGPYSEGAVPGSGQFGVVTVTDLGDRLTVELRGLDHAGTELLSYRYEIAAD
jgi:hypothetical protein